MSELLWKRGLVRTKGSWRDGIEWQLQCSFCLQSYCTKINRSVTLLLIVELFYSEGHYYIRVWAHWNWMRSLPMCDFLEDFMCTHVGHIKLQQYSSANWLLTFGFLTFSPSDRPCTEQDLYIKSRAALLHFKCVQQIFHWLCPGRRIAANKTATKLCKIVMWEWMKRLRVNQRA